MSCNLLRPNSSKNPDYIKRIFNYKLSQGRKTIECTFGIAPEKFVVLNGPIRCLDPATGNNIIKAACILHKFVRKTRGNGVEDYAIKEMVVNVPFYIQIPNMVISEGSP